jgi:hypothetical protein
MLRTLTLPRLFSSLGSAPTFLSRKFASPGVMAPTIMAGANSQLASASASNVGALMQQTRGMKVQSAIKKRCEHCKVRSTSSSYRGVKDGNPGHGQAVQGV